MDFKALRLRCPLSVVSRKRRSNLYPELEMSQIPPRILVYADIMPLRNGLRATNNGRGIFADNR